MLCLTTVQYISVQIEAGCYGNIFLRDLCKQKKCKNLCS